MNHEQFEVWNLNTHREKKNMYFSRIIHCLRRNFTFNLSSFKCTGATFRLGRPFLLSSSLEAIDEASFSFSAGNFPFFDVFFVLSFNVGSDFVSGVTVEKHRRNALRATCGDDGDAGDSADDDDDADEIGDDGDE